MSERKIKVFESFEEQEADHLEWLKSTTPQERFDALFKMQEFDAALAKNQPGKRSIIIHREYLKQ